MARRRDGECIACLENGRPAHDWTTHHECRAYIAQRAYNLGARKRALAAGPVKAWPQPDYSPWATIGEGTEAAAYWGTGDARKATAAGAWVRSFYALAAKPGLYTAFAAAVKRAEARMAQPGWDAELDLPDATLKAYHKARKRRSGSAAPGAPKIDG